MPPGLCVTTEAYDRCLYATGFSIAEEWHRISDLSGPKRLSLLSHCQSRIRQADITDLASALNEELKALLLPSGTRWAVRSSATNEDSRGSSFAGLYRTHLGMASENIQEAIKDLWVSLWHEPVIVYLIQRGLAQAPPSMAVVIQPMLDAEASGVAYSIHPVTGRSNQVAINSVFGLGALLVEGTVMPDQYVVEMRDAQPVSIRRRIIADKQERLVAGQEGLRRDSIAQKVRNDSSLSNDQLFTLARVSKQIEQAFGYPVDLEWVFDAKQLWVLQSRPIAAVRSSSELTNDECEWTRANFKETMPDVPSPMGLSFLQHFMEAYILSHYRRLGCRIPKDVSSVRVLQGRPYLNATLFYSLVGQLGGEPSLNAEQMGGIQLLSPPAIKRLGWLALMRAWWLMLREMRRCIKHGPGWFADMKQQAITYHPDRIKQLTVEELDGQLEALARWLDGHEVTFGIAGGVGQCLQVFTQLLPRWLGRDWRSLFNAGLQGQGTVISARQIVRLAELVQAAQRESAARQWLVADPWEPSGFRERLKDTEFLRAFEGYLKDYGHRAVGESDVMSPRIAEQPESILAVLRTQLCAKAASTPSDILARQAHCRHEALAEIRRRLGWRWDRWWIFQWWYRRLARFFALREANRHHLMYYSTAARYLLRRLGELLVAEGRIDKADDIFFVTLDERVSLVTREPRDWKAFVGTRRADWARHAAIPVPDTIRDWEETVAGMAPSIHPNESGILRGLPISVGCVTGPVRLIRSAADWGAIAQGDILVAPVIDPGMAPLFGIAGGLIVEMGGTLSHGAIIAREYGLPTVANVEGAMTRLLPGQQITLDAGAGTIICCT